VQAPVALIRGEWDGIVPDEDARWLFDAFKASAIKRDVKIVAVRIYCILRSCVLPSITRLTLSC
jgi:hypothetical protein